MMPICFVDTETTGLHTDKQLWEVAIIRREFDVEHRTIDGLHQGVEAVKETRYEAFVPVDLSNADLFGLNVGKFYDRHPMGRYLSGKTNHRDWDETWENELDPVRLIAQNVARFTHGARFIGAAPSFDAEVLGDFLRKHGLLPTWHHRLVDTHDLLIGRHLLTPGQADVYGAKKDVLSRMLGIASTRPELVHTAMGDAQHEADIWDAVMS